MVTMNEDGAGDVDNIRDSDSEQWVMNDDEMWNHW